MRIMSSRRLARQFAPRELHSRHLKTRSFISRLFIFPLAITAIFGGTCYGASELPGANNGGVDFKQWGLLAIQDGGRRKPIDTFAKEALIRVTGRSAYADKTGRKWRPNDFV